MFSIELTDTCANWQNGLRDLRAKQKIVGRLQRMAFGHFGDVASVRHGVGELRIHEGRGHRVYFRRQGQEIILLLCGGDKKSRQRDVAQDHRISNDLEK